MSQHVTCGDVFTCARTVISNIKIDGPLAFPIQIERGILPAVQKIIGDGFGIQIHQKHWPSRQFYSALFRYERHAMVFYSSSLNTCWKRMAICKELGHLIFDEEDKHFTCDTSGLIQRLINTASFNLDDILVSESAGAIIGLETLLPWKLRPELTAMRKAGKSDFEIATHCRVPEKMVSFMMSDIYSTASEKLNQKKDLEEELD